RTLHSFPTRALPIFAEDDVGVLAVARVAQAPDAESPVVHEVAEEDRPPPVRGIRLEGGEEALEVSVDVADDQRRQVVRGHRLDPDRKSTRLNSSHVA